jgi:hypothetical protein
MIGRVSGFSFLLIATHYTGKEKTATGIAVPFILLRIGQKNVIWIFGSRMIRRRTFRSRTFFAHFPVALAILNEVKDLPAGFSRGRLHFVPHDRDGQPGSGLVWPAPYETTSSPT